MSDIATQSSSLRGPRNTDQATGPKLAAPERKQRMTVSCIKRDSPERHKIWSAFRDPHEGEGWQYMGTVNGIHEFPKLQP